MTLLKWDRYKKQWTEIRNVDADIEKEEKDRARFLTITQARIQQQIDKKKDRRNEMNDLYRHIEHIINTYEQMKMVKMTKERFIEYYIEKMAETTKTKKKKK